MIFLLRCLLLLSLSYGVRAKFRGGSLRDFLSLSPRRERQRASKCSAKLSIGFDRGGAAGIDRQCLVSLPDWPFQESASPSELPELTESPSSQLSASPSVLPELTESPSSQSSASPSVLPELSESPSSQSSASPSLLPEPSESPSTQASASPSKSPEPSESPSSQSSASPSLLPEPSDSPSSQPSASPSDSPSSQPSASPSLLPEPSDSPTSQPSASPSKSPEPSDSPSSHPSFSPSEVKTASPTSSYVEPNPVPRNPPRGYFNYDVNDMQYGPSKWHQVDTSQHPLIEFGPQGFGPWKGHLTYEPRQNLCRSRDKKQSPKDMNPSVKCDAHHEIRTRCGKYELSTENYDTLILPHKLSLVMNRSPCLDKIDPSCKKSTPPRADYPRYSSDGSSYSDLINYDIKVPGEHTIKGEKFDAEIQMLHMHPHDPRVSSIGILVRAKEDGFNADFQEILDLFQTVYDEHALECSRRNLKQEQESYSPPSQRRVQSVNRFNPYRYSLMPTMFFYRYDGSITEPPCKDITWWVMELPMIISLEQLNQVKRILFTHVDEDCNPTSVHNADQSVARPIYPRDGGEIQDCSDGAFISDEEKGHGGSARKCWR